jgi:hypothetical protein
MTTTPPTATTELEAVNTMLSVIGEAPVNSLEGAVSTDVLTARSILKELSRSIQNKGWHFNTEYDYPLTPDTNGAITIPANVARISLPSPDNYLTQRGNRLYNIQDRTYTFTETVKVTAVLLLPFEDLPEVARRFILISAARVFSDRMDRNTDSHQFNREDEYIAKADLDREEGIKAHYNILNNPSLIGLKMTRRRF